MLRRVTGLLRHLHACVFIVEGAGEPVDVLDKLSADVKASTDCTAEPNNDGTDSKAEGPVVA